MPCIFILKIVVPKFLFGKYSKERDKLSLPIAINVYYGLMDGYPIGQYIENFQRLLNE